MCNIDSDMSHESTGINISAWHHLKAREGDVYARCCVRHWINILEVDALANCGTARRYCDAFLILNVFILASNVLILNMNVLGNVNMMHINVRNSLLGGCRLNKEAGDAGSLRLARLGVAQRASHLSAFTACSRRKPTLVPAQWLWYN